MLVDDEDMVRYAVASQLNMLGYSVSEARDIATAKNILEQQPIGLILTDIRLGHESGLRFIELIQQLGFHHPVLLMTGYSGRARTDKYGNLPILLKPFTTMQLKEALQKILED